MAVIPEQIPRYIQQEDERERARGMLFPEGMATTREGMTGEGVTAGDIVDVYQGIGTSLLPVDAAQAFGRGDVLGGVGETVEYLAEFTPFPAAYRTGEALLEGDYQTAALESLGVIPFGGRSIRGAAMVDEPPVGTVTRESNRFPEGTSRKLFSGLDKKGDKQPSEFTAVKEQVDVPTVGTSILRPEDLEGSTVIPLGGDRTDAGKILTQVGDVPLAFPVKLQGGLKYMNYSPKNTWALGGSFPTRYKNKVEAAAEKGDVYVSFAPMTYNLGSDFSNQTALTLAAQIPNLNIPKKAIKEFDKVIKEKYPDFVGIDSPDIQNYIENTTGQVNKLIAKTMDSKPFKEAGFPDVGETRLAVTDPQLDTVPTGYFGTGIQRVDPENLLSFETGHLDYPTGLARFEDSPRGMFSSVVSRDLAFPKFIQERRAEGKLARDDPRAISMKIPAEYYDAEVVDTLSEALEERLGLENF